MRYQNTKVKMEKKVWVVSKNDKYVFCSPKCELSDENNVGQHSHVERLLPKYVLLLKIGLKNTQNHDVARGLGVFLSVGVQTSILHPNEVQRVLSTLPEPFYVMLSI